MFKNIEYDLINISKQMEALDTQKDVELLVEANANSFDNLIVEVEEYKRIAAMGASNYLLMQKIKGSPLFRIFRR
jgi:hypothetical protein